MNKTRQKQTMKTFFTIITVAICVVGYAQKKPKINQALSAMEAGDLVEAKLIIDAAIVNEKTKNDPKTWYYRGQIYASLDTANNEPGAIDEALKAFDRALELDPEEKQINFVDFNTGQIVNVSSRKQEYYAFYYNNAITAYNEKAYTMAADNFEKAFYINPADTNAILNAAYAALADGDDQRAKTNFIMSYDAGVRDVKVFLQLYNYAIKEERFEDGLDIIKKGKEAFPNDKDLVKHEINLLIQLEKTGEAKAELEKAIEVDSQNPDLYFTLGVLQEGLGEEKQAMESYQKGVNADPNHYNSNFNLGVSTFNKTNLLIKERNGLNYKEKSKYAELTKQIEESLKVTLPIWEKLYTLENTDQTVLETLSFIYSNLKMKEKAEKIQDELNAQDN